MKSWFDKPLDVLLNLVFGLHKNAPDRMPKHTQFVSSFSMRHSIGWVNFVLLAILSAILCTITYFVDNIMITLLCAGTVVGSFGIVLVEWSIRVRVTEESVDMQYLFFLHKTVRWKDVECVRVIKQERDRLVYIVLYGSDGKSLVDVSSSISNFWLLVKMAEHLDIEIRREKNLTLRQMRHL